MVLGWREDDIGPDSEAPGSTALLHQLQGVPLFGDALEAQLSIDDSRDPEVAAHFNWDVPA